MDINQNVTMMLAVIRYCCFPHQQDTPIDLKNMKSFFFEQMIIESNREYNHIFPSVILQDVLYSGYIYFTTQKGKTQENESPFSILPRALKHPINAPLMHLLFPFHILTMHLFYVKMVLGNKTLKHPPLRGCFFVGFFWAKVNFSLLASTAGVTTHLRSTTALPVVCLMG